MCKTHKGSMSELCADDKSNSDCEKKTASLDIFFCVLVLTSNFTETKCVPEPKLSFPPQNCGHFYCSSLRAMLS